MGMSCVCRGRIVMGEGVVWMMEVRSESVIYTAVRSVWYMCSALLIYPASPV